MQENYFEEEGGGGEYVVEEIYNSKSESKHGPRSSIGNLDPQMILVLMLVAPIANLVWGIGETRNMFLKRMCWHHFITTFVGFLVAFSLVGLPIGVMLLLLGTYYLLFAALIRGTEVRYLPVLINISDVFFRATGGRTDGLPTRKFSAAACCLLSSAIAVPFACLFLLFFVFVIIVLFTSVGVPLIATLAEPLPGKA